MRFTEAPHPNTRRIDRVDLEKKIELLASADREIFGSQDWGPGLFDSEFLEKMKRVQARIQRVLANPRGKVIISGAGTSGRLAYHAAITSQREGKCPGRVFGLMAGGMEAFFQAKEQIEDRPEVGIADLKAYLEDGDEIVFLGISCGLSAAYVAGQMYTCLGVDNATVAVIGFNPLHHGVDRHLSGLGRSFRDILMDLNESDNGFLLNPVLGPEPITGSTRMKGGTATKIILDLLLNPVDIDLALSLIRDFQRQIHAVDPEFQECVEAAGKALRNGFSVAYVAQGQAGFMAILDASECPPTFGADPDQVAVFVDGDLRAFFPGIDMTGHSLDAFQMWNRPGNTVVFVAHESLTPSQIALFKLMKASGTSCFRMTFTGVRCEDLGEHNSVFYRNTRDLALKWALNTLTTCAFIQAGKVHENKMIDLRITNLKLWERAIGIVGEVAGIDKARAEELLRQSIMESPDHDPEIPVEELISRASQKTGIILAAIDRARKTKD